MTLEIGRSVPAETVRYVLHNAGFHNHTPVRESLTEKGDFFFAKNHVSKPQSFWNTVLFSANLICTGETDDIKCGGKLQKNLILETL